MQCQSEIMHVLLYSTYTKSLYANREVNGANNILRVIGYYCLTYSYILDR